MSTQGIKIDVTFNHARSFTDEWLNRFYTSFENNMAILSVDMFVEEDESRVAVLLGIDCPEGLDPDSLVEGIAVDAMDKAIEDADGHTSNEEWNSQVSGRVEAFV